jgi:hypothetical protein
MYLPTVWLLYVPYVPVGTVNAINDALTNKYLSFRQFMPQKPGKYGFLFRSLNDSIYAYTYRSNIYAGCPVDEPSEHYVRGKLKILCCRPAGTYCM